MSRNEKPEGVWADPPPCVEMTKEEIVFTFREQLRASQLRELITMNEEQRLAIERLLKIARRDTGQSRRVADFLLAWYNAGSNGGWDPADLWAVDQSIADDMMTVLGLIRNGPCGKYPNDWGFRSEIEAVWDLWLRPRADARQLEEAGHAEQAVLRSQSADKLNAAAERGRMEQLTGACTIEVQDRAALARAELARRAAAD